MPRKSLGQKTNELLAAHLAETIRETTSKMTIRGVGDRIMKAAAEGAADVLDKYAQGDPQPAGTVIDAEARPATKE